MVHDAYLYIALRRVHNVRFGQYVYTVDWKQVDGIGARNQSTFLHTLIR